jgi:NAD(P)-dependent dehydrogenase (short-subunit alcohol dehydrogenase family)
VRANCICPGAVDTPMTAGVWDNDEARARMKRDVPLGVVARAGDIGSVAGFLLSPDAHHLTGQVMAVDGGSTAS